MAHAYECGWCGRTFPGPQPLYEHVRDKDTACRPVALLKEREALNALMERDPSARTTENYHARDRIDAKLARLTGGDA